MIEFTPFTAAARIIVSVVGVGIALAILGLRALARLDRRIDRLEDSLTLQIATVEHGQTKLRKQMAKLEAELRERMANPEGLLEGLREAITGPRAA